MGLRIGLLGMNVIPETLSPLALFLALLRDFLLQRTKSKTRTIIEASKDPMTLPEITAGAVL